MCRSTDRPESPANESPCPGWPLADPSRHKLTELTHSETHIRGRVGQFGFTLHGITHEKRREFAVAGHETLRVLCDTIEVPRGRTVRKRRGHCIERRRRIGDRRRGRAEENRIDV